MTYDELIKSICERQKLVRSDVRLALKIVIRGLTDALMNGDSVSIPEFGKFKLKLQKPRQWYSPSMDEEVTLKPKLKLRFRSSRLFEKRLTEALVNEVVDGLEDDDDDTDELDL